jgi:acyl-CoA thioester hydrolase
MTFVLETHVTYDRELREGAPLRFTTQLVGRDAKRVHLYHEMFHAEQGYLAATNEVIVMNIDYATRRSAPFPVPVTARLDILEPLHAALPTPAKVGRVMGLKRK